MIAALRWEPGSGCRPALITMANPMMKADRDRHDHERKAAIACPRCGAEVGGRRGRAIYCLPECQRAAHRRRAAA